MEKKASVIGPDDLSPACILRVPEKDNLEDSMNREICVSLPFWCHGRWHRGVERAVTEVYQECRGVKDSGKQGGSRKRALKTRQHVACGNKGRGVRKPVEGGRAGTCVALF